METRNDLWKITVIVIGTAVAVSTVPGFRDGVAHVVESVFHNDSDDPFKKRIAQLQSEYQDFVDSEACRHKLEQATAFMKEENISGLSLPDECRRHRS